MNSAVPNRVFAKTRGFLSASSFLLSFLVVVTLVFLPLAPAFASDDAAAITGDETGAPTEPTSSPDDSTADEPAVTIEEVPDDAPIDLPPELSTELPPLSDEIAPDETVVTEPLPEVSGEVPMDSVESPGEDVVLPNPPVGEESVDEGATSTPVVDLIDTTLPIDEVPSTEVATETIDAMPEPLPSETVPEAAPETPVATATPVFEDASSTTTTEEVSVNSIQNDANAFTFARNECVQVGDGSFYCSSASAEPVVVGVDRVFAASDQDGDREIFIERAGELIRVTDNLLDDDAPSYDELSHAIVWQRLVDGRYQIVSYDIEAEKETLLTNERYNNMQPTRYGDIIVWQGWIGNDWEIMLEDQGELTMLTDNTWHDISPRINGNYIVWQSFEGEAWHVKVYDRTTKEERTIENADGATVDNPRFVLVYDARKENGDIETKGYDLDTGAVVPLSAQPRPAPESIPDPDQTGEKRALLQISTQGKPKQGDTAEPEPTPNPDTAIPPSTATTTEDLVVPPFDSGAESQVGTSTDTVLPDTPEPGSEFELIISVPEEGVTEGTAHIEDVIVVPYTPTQASTSDSQDTVATSS